MALLWTSRPEARFAGEAEGEMEVDWGGTDSEVEIAQAIPAGASTELVEPKQEKTEGLTEGLSPKPKRPQLFQRAKK